MGAAWIKIVVFSIVVAGPIAVLAALGAVSPYGNVAKLPEFPKLIDLVSGKVGSLDALGEALLKRSAATPAAIQVKNKIGVDLLGFIDTKEVVSGTNGWLFYKGEFGCLKEADVRQALAQVDTITELAKAAGIDMIVSISPDKAVIYPEYLSPLASSYLACKSSSSALLRRLIQAEAPKIIDHAVPILAEKKIHPGLKLYFKTDTHWTPYGAALALRQLLSAVNPKASAGMPPRVSGSTGVRQTDMRNRMLLQTDLESYDELDAKIETSLSEMNQDPPGYKTAILHDSFYDFLQNKFLGIFPNLKTFSFEQDEKAFSEAIATTDRLIVNSVERSFPGRAGTGVLSWNGALAKAILRRNEFKAKECSNFVPGDGSDGTLTLHNVAQIADGWKPSGPDPQIIVTTPVGEPGQFPCLRINLSAVANVLVEVFLQNPLSHDGFHAGRSVLLRTAGGKQEITVVLPSFVAGLALRIDPGVGMDAPAVINSIRFGRLNVSKEALWLTTISIDPVVVSRVRRPTPAR